MSTKEDRESEVIYAFRSLSIAMLQYLEQEKTVDPYEGYVNHRMLEVFKRFELSSALIKGYHLFVPFPGSGEAELPSEQH